jgi:hypothetical protein
MKARSVPVRNGPNGNRNGPSKPKGELVQPVNRLQQDLLILRAIARLCPGKLSPGLDGCTRRQLLDNGLRRQGIDDRVLGKRLGSLRKQKLVEWRRFEDARFSYALTPAGRKRVEESADLDFAAPELEALTAGIITVIDDIAALSLTVDEAELKGLECRHALGKKFSQAKDIVGHGWWLAYLRLNVRRMSVRNVERHIKYGNSTFTSNLREEKRKWREISGNLAPQTAPQTLRARVNEEQHGSHHHAYEKAQAAFLKLSREERSRFLTWANEHF